ncbi:MAG: proline reductase-associated electron transfer protein PrdC [Sporolactobacillus sp.]
MKDVYRLLLKQFVGEASRPCVRVGDAVRVGERVAVAAAEGADLHASAEGVVTQVDGESVVIEGDVPAKQSVLPIEGANDLDKVRAAGLVGMGGAGYPTADKLSRLATGGIIIANGAECEPIFAHNVTQMTNDPEKICRGVLHALDMTGASRGVIAVKTKHRQAIAALNRAITDPRLSVFPLIDRYPAGEERALVRDILGVLLAPSAHPCDIGALVLNVETLARLADAIDDGRPVVAKNLTVAGTVAGLPKTQVFTDVPIGTPISKLICAFGASADDYDDILIGGPFTGRYGTEQDVVTKRTSAVILMIAPLKEAAPLGLLVCACGAKEARMREIAGRMGASVVASQYCKHAERVGERWKCRNPGICPGQAERVLQLKKAGAKALLIGNCSDCSNTVMAIAPKLGLRVHHTTDAAMRTMHQRLIRKLDLQDGQLTHM